MEIPSKNRDTIYDPGSSNSTPGHISWEKHNSEMYKHHDVHYSTIYNSQDMETTKMSTDRRMDKEDVVQYTMDYYSTIKMLFAATWMDVEVFRLKEVSQKEKDKYHIVPLISSVQSLSHTWLFATPWTAARQASLSITNSWSLPRLMSIELVMPFNHLILCRPLLLPLSIFPSIRVFSNESALHIGWTKFWSFSFSISPSSAYSVLISFRMDWLDLLAVQGTLKSLLQHRSSKASIL